jgi:hypothetical protein
MILVGSSLASAVPRLAVWVIAETTDLPTKFGKIVVTDDAGRYVLPDLPKANYNVWVRGYGLVDSPKVRAAPGKLLNLTATQAPTACSRRRRRCQPSPQRQRVTRPRPLRSASVTASLQVTTICPGSGHGGVSRPNRW